MQLLHCPSQLILLGKPAPMEHHRAFITKEYEMSKQVNNKVSRRKMLKTSAAAGAVAGAGIITGFPAVHAQEAPTIRYLGTAVNMGSEPEKRLFEDTGIKVQYISKTTDEVTKTILTQPNSFDIVDSEYFSMPKLAVRKSAWYGHQKD